MEKKYNAKSPGNPVFNYQEVPLHPPCILSGKAAHERGDRVEGTHLYVPCTAIGGKDKRTRSVSSISPLLTCVFRTTSSNGTSPLSGRKERTTKADVTTEE